MTVQLTSKGCMLMIQVYVWQIYADKYLERKFSSTRKIGKQKLAYKAGERVERGHLPPLDQAAHCQQGVTLTKGSKVYEAVICNQLDEQLDLTRQRYQWAYKKGKSTESLLLYLSEVWKNAIKNGKVGGAMFIDCSNKLQEVAFKCRHNLYLCEVHGANTCNDTFTFPDNPFFPSGLEHRLNNSSKHFFDTKIFARVTRVSEQTTCTSKPRGHLAHAHTGR